MSNIRPSLDRMLDADPQLYERILDTPRFASAFNELCLLAQETLLPLWQSTWPTVDGYYWFWSAAAGEEPEVVEVNSAGACWFRPGELGGRPHTAFPGWCAGPLRFPRVPN